MPSCVSVQETYNSFTAVESFLRVSFKGVLDRIFIGVRVECVKDGMSKTISMLSINFCDKKATSSVYMIVSFRFLVC